MLFWIPLFKHTAKRIRQRTGTTWGVFLLEKILRKINYILTDGEIEGIVEAQDLAVEKFLLRLKQFVDKSTGQVEEQIKIQHQMTNKEKFEMTKQKKVEAVVGEEDNSEKGKLVKELKETIAILENKVAKMEMVVKVKDEKIRFLSKKLESDIQLNA